MKKITMICDRCGQEYDSKFRPDYRVMYNGGARGIDLCSECTNDLKEWLEPSEKEDEQDLIGLVSEWDKAVEERGWVN